MKMRTMSPRNRWLYSYITVVCSVLAVVLVILLIACYQIKRESENSNDKILQYFAHMIDSRLSSLDEMSYELLHSNTSERLQEYDSRQLSTGEGLKEAYDIVYSIRNYATVNTLVEDVYLYYPSSDYIIGKTGSYHSYTYFKTEFVSPSRQLELYQSWMDQLFQSGSDGYRMDAESANVYLVRSAPMGGSWENKRILVTKISQQRLDEYLAQLMETEQWDYLAITDYAGRLLASVGEADGLVADGILSGENLPHGKLLYKANSNVLAFQIVAIQSSGNAYRFLTAMAVLMALGVAVALFVGIIISVMFNRKSGQVVTDIFNKLNLEGTGSLTQSRVGDLTQIAGKIDLLLSENALAVEVMEQQEKRMEFSFVKELLYSNISTESEADNLCSVYNINMENSLFALVVAKPYRAGSGSFSPDEMWDFVKNAQHEDFLVYWTQTDEMDVFLCNFESDKLTQSAPVLEFIRQLRLLKSANCEVVSSGVLSSLPEVAGHWRKQWRQKENIQALGVDSYLEMFAKALSNEDFPAARQIAARILTVIDAYANQNLQLCQRYALMKKLYQAAFAEKLSRDLDALAADVGKSDWNGDLDRFLLDLEKNLTGKAGNMRSVAEQARQIVREEYSNAQLGLPIIAERIGVSQSYLAKVFKQKYGTGVIHYLNQVRIENAKRRFLESDESINVIAMEVGFLSDVNFIRVFKKFEEITPGKYRSNQKER